MSRNNMTVCEKWPSLERFAAVYEPIHAYFALAVCVFGSLTNILNVIVLTQKSMHSPTNTLLTGIAIVDIVTMVAYEVDNVYLNIITAPNPTGYAHSPTMIRVILLQHVLIIGSHVIATVLLVELAAFRCWIIYTITSRPISHGNGSKPACEKRLVTMGFVGATLCGIFVSLPTFFIYIVREHAPNRHNNRTTSGQPHYWFELRSGAERLENAQFVIYGCLIKILASIFIFLFTTIILVGMRIANRRYMELQSLSKKPVLIASYVSTADANISTRLNTDPNDSSYAEDRTKTEETRVNRLAHRNKQSQRASIMLIVVVISFVITEFPQGVVNTMVAIEGECFHNSIYAPLGNVLDLAVLINSSINFILYCTMSQMFRSNFTRLILRFCSCARPVARSSQSRPPTTVKLCTIR